MIDYDEFLNDGTLLKRSHKVFNARVVFVVNGDDVEVFVTTWRLGGPWCRSENLF